MDERQLKQSIEKAAQDVSSRGPLQELGRAGVYYSGATAGQLDGAMDGPAAGRVEARSMLRAYLEEKRDSLRAQANQVQTLLDALPAKLPSSAEQALFQLFK